MQTRFLAALGTSWMLALLPSLAAAQSAVNYTDSSLRGPVPQDARNTDTKLRYEYYNNANALIGTSLCNAPTTTCNPRFPVGTAKYSVLLEYDPAREELLSETCKGVASTVLQGQCIDGALRVTLRVRWGTVKFRFVPDARPGRNIAAPSFGNFGPDARIEFSADGSKYWSPSRYNAPGASGGYAVAVGNYKVVAPNMAGFCKPVQTNPNNALSVNEGQTIEYTVRYTGTVCTMSINTSYGRSVAAGGTFSSEPERLNCPGVTNATNCKAEFPFDSTVRLKANAAPGYVASFGRNFTGCSREEPNPAICEILADGDRELSTAFYLATTPPPPPPPVALSASAGPIAPADATVAKGSNTVAMLQVVLTPANGVARLNALTLQASGSGRDDLDLADIHVYRDSNANGSVDPGEPLLASGRAAADNGTLRLALGTPLEFSEPTTLLVAADITSTVHSAAAVTGGGLMLAMGVIGLTGLPNKRAKRAPQRKAGAPRGRRLRLVCAGAFLALLVACGGGGGGEVAATEPPVVVPPVVVPPPVLLTYRLQLTGVEATDTAATPATLSVGALPIAGAVITVEQ